MKKQKTPTLHILLIFGALALAFSLRLIGLGVEPLSNSEAAIALEALSVARGEASDVGSFPAVVGLTGLDFLIFNSGNFLARLWPAMISALIVLVPFLFREQIGLPGSAAASIILALAPEMIGLSRLLGTPMMALVCLLLGSGFYYRGKPLLMGISLALGLMSGPGFWLGIIVLGFSILVADWLFDAASTFNRKRFENRSHFWLLFGLSFGLVILVVGSRFFMDPQGLSGILAGLVQFVRGIFQPASTTIGLRLLSFLAYAGGAFALGAWGIIRGLVGRNKLDLTLIAWAAFGLIFFLVYPGGGPDYLPNVTLPLWLLAIRAFISSWHFPENSRLVVTGTAILVVVVTAFMLLALRTLIRPGLTQAQQINTLVALIGGLFLLVAVVLLIKFGWAEKVALAGLLSGLSVVALVSLMAVSINTTSLSTERSIELWLAGTPQVTAKWLQVSIDRVLNWNSKGDEPVEIAVTDFEQPAMVWILRDYQAVNFETYMAPTSQPGILITDIRALPEISSAYRGQDLVWSREVLWGEMSAFQYLEWLITRDAPTQENQIILWVRTDLMPDEQFAP